MYKNLIYIDTKNMSHEEWLEQRRQGIGGSDAGAVIGVNKWRSPYTVYCDKLGKLPPIEDNERKSNEFTRSGGCSRLDCVNRCEYSN